MVKDLRKVGEGVAKGGEAVVGQVKELRRVGEALTQGW